MNKLNGHLKYAEYLLRKWRSFFTTDLHFHTTRLYKSSGKLSNLRQPVTLNEKLCHRLIFDHNTLYTFLADKLAVREYVHARTQKIKTVPLIGIYNKAEDIDFSVLPEKFVLKCNHEHIRRFTHRT